MAKAKKLSVLEKYSQLVKQTLDAGMTIVEKDGKLIVLKKPKK